MNDQNLVVVRGFETRDTGAHIQQITAELWLALQRTERSELGGLVGDLPGDFAAALGRRAKNLATLATGITGWAWDEISGMWGAAAQGALADHLTTRTGTAVESARLAYVQVRCYGKLVLESPREQLPRIFVIVSAALLVSGGLDGDGGIPDLDIPLFGIGAHRSPLTHSFFTGAVLETLAIALIRTIALVHKNLPANRHPAWDKLTPKLIKGIEDARGGAALGLAYHFLVDGVLQPAPYHGLPIEMPLEAHQAIFVATGLAEASSHAEEVSAPEVEPVVRQWQAAWLVTRVVQKAHVSSTMKLRFLAFALGTRVSLSPPDLAQPKLNARKSSHVEGHAQADIGVGTVLRCTGCNRCRAISDDFYAQAGKRLGRPLAMENLWRLGCRECGAKRSAEVVHYGKTDGGR